MTKHIFALSLGAMLFALSYSASAQQPKKVLRVGFLSLPFGFTAVTQP
jgi:hypothetical protein